MAAIRMISARMTRSFRILAVATCTGFACNGATGPEVEPAFDQLWVAGSEVRLLDLASGLERSVLSFEGMIESAVMPPGSEVMWLGVVSGLSRELVQLDVCSESITARRTLSSLADGGIALLTAEILAEDQAIGALYVWRASAAGVTGVAVLDQATLVPTGFMGPWNVVADGIVPVSANGWLGAGGIALVASRSLDAPREGEAVFFIDRETTRDSLTTDDLTVPETEIQGVVYTDGRDRLVVEGASWLVAFDTRSKTVVQAVPRPATGELVPHPDGSLYLLGDVGDWPDRPGSGVLTMFDADLDVTGSIDLSTPLGGAPNSPTATVIRRIVLDPDQPLAYVSTGTPARGPLYPVQTSKLISVDLVEGEVIGVHDFGDHELGAHFIYSCPMSRSAR